MTITSAVRKAQLKRSQILLSRVLKGQTDTTYQHSTVAVSRSFSVLRQCLLSADDSVAVAAAVAVAPAWRPWSQGWECGTKMRNTRDAWHTGAGLVRVVPVGRYSVKIRRRIYEQLEHDCDGQFSMCTRLVIFSHAPLCILRESAGN